MLYRILFFSSLSRVPFTRLFLENISLTSKTQFRIYFANLLLIQSMFTWMLFFLVQHCLRYLPQKHHFCDSGSMNRVIENWLSWRFSKPVSKCGLIILSDNSKCINSLDFRIREKLYRHTHTQVRSETLHSVPDITDTTPFLPSTYLLDISRHALYMISNMEQLKFRGISTIM